MSKLQLRASFKYMVSYRTDRKWSRNIGKKWRIKGGRSRHRELEISAPIEVVTLGGLQHDWGWVSEGVLETGQGESFVPAAATFQSATDIYTPALIERLVCEPSACTCTNTLLLCLSSSRSFTIADTAADQLSTPRSERPDMMRLCFEKKSHEAKFAHVEEIIQLKVEFRICLILKTHGIWILLTVHLQESCALGHPLYYLHIWNWAMSHTNIKRGRQILNSTQLGFIYEAL